MIGHRLLVALPMAASTFTFVAACGGPTPSPAATQEPVATSSALAGSPLVTPESPGAPTAASPTAGPGSPTPAPATPAASVVTPTSGWLQQEVGTAPSAREDHTWTVAADTEMAYLFGGRGADGPLNDLWAFDLAELTWAEIHVTDAPVPDVRFGHTATWVPDVGLVMWSGQGSSGFFDDIWAYDPDTNAWQQLPSSGAVPPARYGSCASLGPDGELWISHGFTEDAGRFADTRSYNFSTGTWTDRTPQDRVPVERCLHDCFWSTETNQLVLYGGQTTGVPALGDVWAYDLATGTWTRGPDSTAPARQLYALASTGQSAFIFGGGSVDRLYLDDTWMLDPATLELIPFGAEGPAPAPRSGAAMILDPAHAAGWLFGGTNDDGVQGDTWMLFTART